MALLGFDGFDNYASAGGGSDVANRRAGNWQWNAVSSQGFVTGRGGVGSALNLLGGSLQGTLTQPVQTGIVGMAVFMTFNIQDIVSPSVSFIDSRALNGSTGLFNPMVQVHFDFDLANGAVSAYRFNPVNGEYVLLASSANNAFTTFGWHFIELKLTISKTAGVVAARINGEMILNVGGLNTQASANAQWDTMAIGAGATQSGWTIDDFYVCDGSIGQGPYLFNDFVGDAKVATLNTIGNGPTITWTPLANSNWQEVSQVHNDGDASYNTSAIGGAIDLFNFAPLPQTITQVLAVQVTGSYRKDDVGTRTLQQLLTSAGTVVAGQTIFLPTTYVYVNDLWAADPASNGPWTLSAVNALQAGYELVAAPPPATISIVGVSLSPSSALANSTIGSTIGTLSASASGGTLTGITFSIASQSTPGAFRVAGALLQFNSATVAAGTYTLSIQVNALNAVNSPQAYAVTVGIDASASPAITGVALSAASAIADSPIGTAIGTLSATASGGALSGTSFSLVSQSTAGAFSLSGTTLQFASASVPAGSYSLTVAVSATNASNSPQTYPLTVTITPVAVASNFAVVSGQIIDPHGNLWHGRGINIADAQMAEAVSNAAAEPLLTLFPNTNIVRLACFSYQPASAYASFITTLTALGIVVEIEDHTSSDGTNSGGGTGVVYTGTLLNNELAWYAALATAYADNPYVWFGTNNEPSITPSVAALSTWHQQTYNAIRGAGAANMIMIMEPAGGLPQALGSAGGMTASVYAPMHNIAWDLHSYNWVVGFSTDYATNYNQLVASIALCQQITSADGIVPVIIGEYGDSTVGNAEDAGWLQNCQAVQNSVGAAGGSQGSMAWLWNPGSGFFDNLCTATAVNSPYGTEVAAWIATAS